MNDLEFDILDELYFIIPFQELFNKLQLEKSQLFDSLSILIRKGFVRCYKADLELEIHEIEFKLDKFEEYKFLASKKGLMEHNTL